MGTGEIAFGYTGTYRDVIEFVIGWSVVLFKPVNVVGGDYDHSNVHESLPVRSELTRQVRHDSLDRSIHDVIVLQRPDVHLAIPSGRSRQLDVRVGLVISHHRTSRAGVRFNLTEISESRVVPL